MKCPVCNKENRHGARVCEHCGNDLYTVLLEKVATERIDSERSRVVASQLTMPSSNPVVIYIQNALEPLALARVGKITFGRRGFSAESHELQIDLTPYGGEELGVSRLHASIDVSSTPPILTDLGGTNGTFINGQRLVPLQVYTLQTSDEVRLGQMILRVFYDAEE